MQAHDNLDRSEAGRWLGYDLFRYSWTPPHEDRWQGVQEGFVLARERGLPALKADRFQRKWMQLRLSAHRRGRSFDQNITPGLIKHFRQAAPEMRSEIALRLFAETVHQQLKGLEHACDVWLQPGVMKALLAWWQPLDGAARGRAGEIARLLSHGRLISPDRLRTWKLDTRGYAHA